jgi:exopolysaccharide biosynthesis predicted pyruvyltransferase EpsI
LDGCLQFGGLGGVLRDELGDKIDRVLTPLLTSRAEHICIIDAPGHPNVGDNAILLGELCFISKRFPKARVTFYDAHSYSPEADRYIEEASVLFIHGGGNFGDIWPHHHRLRKRILERFPHKPIIQAPQSIAFTSETERDATARAIAAHGDFTLLVRDRKSLDYARRHFACQTQLTPDMAFAMPPLSREKPHVDYLCLLRTDKERLIDHDSIMQVLETSGRSVLSDDWLREPTGWVANLDRSLVRQTRRRPWLMAPFRSAIMGLRRAYAEQRVRYGVRLLSQGAAVVTDRLHAHILCHLSGIPDFAFDSFDGKISAFHGTWMADAVGAALVGSPEELAVKLDLGRKSGALS